VLCTDIFMEVEDCEGDHIYRFILHSGNFSNLKVRSRHLKVQLCSAGPQVSVVGLHDL